MTGVFSSEEKISILKDLVAIKSVNDNELEVAQYLQKLFNKHGIEAKIIPSSGKRANLVAEIGHGHPILAVSGHMDVVEPGDLDKWTSDPFKLTERDGKLYGRGITDMKAGLAALVIAMITLHDQDIELNGTVRLLATFGEEMASYGAKELYPNGYMDDVDALLITEPTANYLAIGHKGSMNITVTSRGKAAHSSMPELGYNAIDPLMEVMTEASKIFRNTKERNELLGKLTFNTTIFKGGIQVNSIPDNAVTEASVRTIPEYNNDRVISTLNNLIESANKDSANLTLDVNMSHMPVYTTGNSKFIDLARQVSIKYLGSASTLMTLPGGTDASTFLSQKGPDFPFLVFGPGNESAHKVDEYVDRETYLIFTELYADLFTQYLS